MTMSYFIFVTQERHAASAAHARQAGHRGERAATVFANATRVS
ncbi:hypothetical protein PHO31112_01527 [Pandoraea horticolens]|uniref:Uncharacterized protein n=1 Tax=Pandoraea horticolens TaxID=2508298 RepID=A0A5E4TN02_9BURK|nr:hypothetical protein PHO31112_01527 [Pandoraea horticolens]